MTGCELHGDVLSEVNILARNLDNIEPRQEISRNHPHLSPGKTRVKVSSRSTCLHTWKLVRT